VCTCISPQARTRGWASSCIASRRTCASSQVATGLGPHDMGIGVHIHLAPSPTWLGSTPTTSPTTVNAQPRTLKSRQVSSSLVKSRQHTAGSTLNPASRPHGHQRHSHQRHGRLTVSSYCKSYCLFLRSCHASRKHAAAAETPKSRQECPSHQSLVKIRTGGGLVINVSSEVRTEGWG